MEEVAFDDDNYEMLNSEQVTMAVQINSHKPSLPAQDTRVVWDWACNNSIMVQEDPPVLYYPG